MVRFAFINDFSEVDICLGTIVWFDYRISYDFKNNWVPFR